MYYPANDLLPAQPYERRAHERGDQLRKRTFSMQYYIKRIKHLPGSIFLHRDCMENIVLKKQINGSTGFCLELGTIIRDNSSQAFFCIVK